MSKGSETESVESEQSGEISPQSSASASPNLTLLETGQNPGNILKAAREKLGLEISEVSSKTKINEHQVVAIESGDLDRLPPATFAKAFIKSYCKVVELDPQPILLAFGFEGGVTKPPVVAPAESGKRVVSPTNLEPTMPKNSRRLSSLSFERKSNSKRAGLIIALVAAALFAAVYLPEFFSSTDEEALVSPAIEDEPVLAQAPEQVVPTEVEPLAPVDPVANVPEGQANQVEPQVISSPEERAGESAQEASTSEGMIQEPLPLPIDSGGEQAKTNSVFPAIREEQAKTQAKQEPIKPIEPESEPVAQAPKAEENQQVEQSNPSPKQFKLEPGNSALQFVFANESWVTVRDATNRVLLSQLNSAGERVQIQGRPPFKLIVGKAGTVRLFKDGVPVDLGPHIRGEVARLTLR